MGIEQPPASQENNTPSAQGGAESGAVGGEIDHLEPDLAEIVKAWPALSAAVRKGIVEMVRATHSDEDSRR